MIEEGYYLVVQTGPGTGQTYQLGKASMTIGRYPLADVVIDAPEVDYRHATITFSGDAYRLADLASDAGTYVNGRRIGAEPVELSPGDIILLGTHTTIAFLQAGDAPVQADEESLAPEDAAEAAPAVGPAKPQSDSAETGERQTPDETDRPPGMTEPARAPIHPEPMPPLPPLQKTNNRRLLLITAGCLLLLGCCCSATLFMYFIGGDWLLFRMGLLP
jgi:hypothetical protein